jgi:hypothetical protein
MAYCLICCGTHGFEVVLQRLSRAEYANLTELEAEETLRAQAWARWPFPDADSPIAFASIKALESSGLPSIRRSISKGFGFHFIRHAALSDLPRNIMFNFGI